MHDTRSHFRELDGSYVNGLNEELPILRGLVRIKVLDTNLSNMGGGDRAYLVVVRLLRLLELLFEEECYLFNITAGRHAEDDTHRLTADFHISTG